MEVHKFFQQYADTPLEKRYDILSNDFTSSVFGITLDDVYKEVNELQNRMRPLKIRQQKLIDAVELIKILKE